MNVHEMNHNNKYEYEGVTLRPLEHNDIEMLRKWRNDSTNARYLRKIPFITVDMQEKWFEEYLADENIMTFSIVENVILGRMVGSLSLYQFSGDGKVELGNVLIGDTEAHGKRVGFRAVTAAVKAAIERLHRSEIYLHVDENNFAAITIYKQAGFKESNRNENELLMKYCG